MTSTTHEEEAIEEGDRSNTPSESNSSQEGDLQESRSSDASQAQRPAVFGQEFLTIGSSKKDVARVQGTPTKIHEFHSAGSWWYYGDSKINFDWRGRIESWDNSDNNLKVRMAIE
jgi:hypothetical protein